MRIKLLFALLLLPVCAQAHDTFTVSGRIVNEAGAPVEYVQVGIPKIGVGTVSSLDGRFEIKVAADTLEFHHVSYQVGYYPVSGPEKDLLIVLKDTELPPAVFIGGNTKEKYLLHPGTRFLGAAGGIDFREGGIMGWELGSVAEARRPFLVKDIIFSIQSNYIPGCVVSINIYRIESEPKKFINVLHKPLYTNVAVSEKKQDFDIQPEETILLEPGRYFISFEVVDYDMDTVSQDPKRMHLYTNLYFKSSYYRKSSLAKFQYVPVNIGITVKGLEYR